jgi:predicted DNA-binding transcriptional regulator AlpA
VITGASAREPLWRVPDVMAFLRVSRSWVYQRAASNLIPHLKIAGLLRFEPEAIRSFASMHAHRGPAEPVRR